jgi:deoxyribonuclease V
MMLWPKNLNEARRIQFKLKDRIKIVHLKGTPKRVAGVDAAFSGGNIIGTACLYTYPGGKLLEEVYSVTKYTFPYVPGFLSFREGPVIIKALSKLTIKPDIILFDGQGIAHPAGMGIASHLGILLKIPSIGCAKSRLLGDYEEPGQSKGIYSSLTYRGETIGAVIRTRDNVKPLFVSPGHMVDLNGAVEIVMNCLNKYRLPEPLRRADYLSKKLKRVAVLKK